MQPRKNLYDALQESGIDNAKIQPSSPRIWCNLESHKMVVIHLRFIMAWIQGPFIMWGPVYFYQEASRTTKFCIISSSVCSPHLGDVEMLCLCRMTVDVLFIIGCLICHCCVSSEWTDMFCSWCSIVVSFFRIIDLCFIHHFSIMHKSYVFSETLSMFSPLYNTILFLRNHRQWLFSVCQCCALWKSVVYTSVYSTIMLFWNFNDMLRLMLICSLCSLPAKWLCV